MGEPQGVLQLLLLSAQLIEQQLQLNEPVGEMADGDRGEALVIGAEGGTGSGRWGHAQGGEQCQCLGATGAGSPTAGLESACPVGASCAAEAAGMVESAEPLEPTGSATVVAVGSASGAAVGAAEKPGVAAVPTKRPRWAEAARAMRRWERAMAIGNTWVEGSEAKQGLGQLDGGSAAKQLLGIGLELVQGRQELIAAEQFDRGRQGGAIDRVAAQQGAQLHHRHLIPGPVPGIGGVCVVGAERVVLPAIGSLGRCRAATAGLGADATAAGGGGRAAASRPGQGAAGFNAEQALQLSQPLKQGADRLQQGAAAGTGCGNGRGCGLGGGGGHGVAARGRDVRRGGGAAGGARK